MATVTPKLPKAVSKLMGEKSLYQASANIIAISMPDAVLVAHKSDGQRMKEVVAALKSKGAKQATHFRVITDRGAGLKAWLCGTGFR